MAALIYLDASVLTALFILEARTADAHTGILDQHLVTTPLGLAEVSSAIGLRVRRGELDATAAAAKLVSLDGWTAQNIAIAEFTTQDFIAATQQLRRFELALRTPDALHIAAALRLNATLFTFDAKMAAAATALGVQVLI